jgi:hypothetical protein
MAREGSASGKGAQTAQPAQGLRANRHGGNRQLVLNTRAEALREAQEFFSKFRRQGQALVGRADKRIAAGKRAASSMIEYVLDSTAVIALVPGARLPACRELLEKSAVSAVNLAEIFKQARSKGFSAEEYGSVLAKLELKSKIGPKLWPIGARSLLRSTNRTASRSAIGRASP